MELMDGEGGANRLRCLRGDSGSEEGMMGYVRTAWGCECVTQTAGPGRETPSDARDIDKALLPRDCLGLATVSIASRGQGERQRETLIELIDYRLVNMGSFGPSVKKPNPWFIWSFKHSDCEHFYAWMLKFLFYCILLDDFACFSLCFILLNTVFQQP